VVVALVASVLAVAGGGLAAAFSAGQDQAPGTTDCVWGASAVGPITIDEQGDVTGNTTPATIGCVDGGSAGGAGP
jgi:hypothetical protein